MPLENPLARAARESRYDFARRRLDGGVVLEAGCGARDGALLLADEGNLVVAVDVSLDGVRAASASYVDRRVHYMVMDCQRLAFRDACFDAVVSLEVVEHLADPGAYFSEVSRVLRPEGVYIGSTPNRERDGFRPNPHHIREYIASDYRDLLQRYFHEVSLFGQRPKPLVVGRGLGFRRGVTRFDRLGLRRLVPQVVKDVINRRLFHLKSARWVDSEDWEMVSAGEGDAEIEGAVVFCCVCRGRA